MAEIRSIFTVSLKGFTSSVRTTVVSVAYKIQADTKFEIPSLNLLLISIFVQVLHAFVVMISWDIDVAYFCFSWFSKQQHTLAESIP